MKTNKMLKISVTLSTLVALFSVLSTPVNAAGAYGSDNVLAVVDDVEYHETVDAGLENLAPQLVTTLVALSGLITTSVLVKRTK